MKKIMFFIVIILVFSSCIDKEIFHVKSSEVAAKQLFTELKVENKKFREPNQIDDYMYYGGVASIEERKDLVLGLFPRNLVYKFNENIQNGSFIAFSQSGSTNLVYNLSYFIHLPKNYILNILYDIKILRGKAYTAYGNPYEVPRIMGIVYIITDTIALILGACLAFIMFFVGTITGTLLHPIRTIGDPATCFKLLIYNIVTVI